MRHITCSCNQKGSYPVMNSTEGAMLQRMGSGKQNEKLKRRVMQEEKNVRKRGRDEENMSKGIE